MLKAFESELFLNNHILALSPEPLDEVCFFIYSNEGYFKVFSPRAPPLLAGRMGIYSDKNVKTHSLNNS